MRKRCLSITLLTLFLISIWDSEAQQNADTCQIYIAGRNIYVQEDSLYLDLHFSVEGIQVNTDQKLILELIVESGVKKVNLPPVVFTGKRKERFDRRNRILAGNNLGYAPYHVYRDIQTNKIYTFDYIVSIPFARWMKSAELQLKQIHESCCESKEFSQMFDLNIKDDQVGHLY